MKISSCWGKNVLIVDAEVFIDILNTCMIFTDSIDRKYLYLKKNALKTLSTELACKFYFHTCRESGENGVYFRAIVSKKLEKYLCFDQ